MATVVSITNPITGAVEQVDKLDHTAQQIDDAVALSPQLSNPNLLDNWYFGNPVNQRGQTEYTAGGYTIDRWKFEVDGSSKSVIVSGEGVEIKSGDDATYCNFAQIVERLPAGTYTVSFLVDDFANVNQVFCSATNTSSFSFDKNVVSLKFTITADTKFVNIGIQKKLNAAALTIIAAKLELGSQQTLAHQDADGNWVLNEIPDYGEQLARCQRYQVRVGYAEGSTYAPAIAYGIATSSTSIRAMIPTPVTMRTHPSISYFGSDTISTINIMGGASASLHPTNVLAKANSNGVLLILTVSGATQNETYVLSLGQANGLLLDANL